MFHLSISPHFSFRHHLLFVSVSTERLRADRVRFARPERKRQPGRDANSPGIPMSKQKKKKKNVPSRVEGRFPKQVFSSTCCLLKSQPPYRVSGVQTVDDVDARDDTGQRASRSERIGMHARRLC